MTTPTKVSQYNRRRYTIEGDALDKAKTIRLTVEVDGVKYVSVQAREPGIVAFVSRATEQGFDIEIVEAGGVRFTDRMLPSGETSEPLAPWQIEALKLER